MPACALSGAAALELLRELEVAPIDDALQVLRNNQTYRTAINSPNALGCANAYADKRERQWRAKAAGLHPGY